MIDEERLKNALTVNPRAYATTKEAVAAILAADDSWRTAHAADGVTEAALLQARDAFMGAYMDDPGPLHGTSGLAGLRAALPFLVRERPVVLTDEMVLTAEKARQRLFAGRFGSTRQRVATWDEIPPNIQQEMLADMGAAITAALAAGTGEQAPAADEQRPGFGIGPAPDASVAITAAIAPFYTPPVSAAGGRDLTLGTHVSPSAPAVGSGNQTASASQPNVADLAALAEEAAEICTDRKATFNNVCVALVPVLCALASRIRADDARRERQAAAMRKVGEAARLADRYPTAAQSRVWRALAEAAGAWGEGT